MHQQFIDKKLGVAKLRLVGMAREIIDSYQAQGYRLTLRQLFYQMVSRDFIPNTSRSYKILGGAISDGRLVGLVDWAAIEDRIRTPHEPPEFANLEELVEAALQSYRLPRWKGQPYYVELWVEKDALAGVLLPIALRYHVILMVNRGYSSQSAMYEASKRFIRAEREGRTAVLLYLGDHDPSGEDMVRDIQDRMEMFRVDALQVRKVALTMEQVEEYNPPPNPAKLSDSRAQAYIAQHGGSSWEVDALPPDVLERLIVEAITRYLDPVKMQKIINKEKRDRTTLKRAVKKE